MFLKVMDKGDLQMYLTNNIHSGELVKIKMMMESGALSYNEAKIMAEPHLDAINDINRETAKKYGMRPKKITFSQVMR